MKNHVFIRQAFNRLDFSRPDLSGLAVFGLALLLAGCGTSLTGSKPAALDTVTLSAASLDKTAARFKAQILIAEPKALKIYDSQNIVVSTSATGLEYLGGAQWADRLPSLVQVKLAEALQNAGFAGVGLPGQGLAIDYQLISEIREFSIRTDGSDRARVAIFVKLLNDRNGDVVASRLFEAETAVSSGQYPAALDAAFTLVSNDIVVWLPKNLRR
jgi:cholesterol transport system auxiliary component